MEFSLNIEMGNAAFDVDGGRRELVLILKSLASDLEHSSFPLRDLDVPLRDHNGNKVGRAIVEGERASDLEPVAYWVQDTGGNEVERFPAKGSRHDGNTDLLDSFLSDAERVCDEYNAELREEHAKWMESETAAPEPDTGRYAIVVELRNGDTTSEHATLP